MPKIVPHAREDILEKSRSMLRVVGYDAFNMRALAKQCSISVGTLYNYFPSKYHIVASIMQKDWGNMLEEMDGIISMGHDPLVLLSVFYDKIQHLFTSTHSLWVESYAILKDANMDGVKLRREEVKVQLVDRMLCILKQSMLDEPDLQGQQALHWGADGLVRLILSYCGDSHVDEREVLYTISVFYQALIGGIKQ